MQKSSFTIPSNGVSFSPSSQITAPSSQQLDTVQSTVPPPPIPAIKTVSNGSALYSVLYAGSGNKITIKRKTEPAAQHDDDLHSINPLKSGYHQPQIKMTNPSPAPSLQEDSLNFGLISNSNNFKKPSMSRAKVLAKRKGGCRCGNATLMPGKLTCCGQRCPCYVDSKSCIDCKCRGCRNPHRPNGFKVRPHIPELENLDFHLNAAAEGTYITDNSSFTFADNATTTTNHQGLGGLFNSNLSQGKKIQGETFTVFMHTKLVLSFH